MSERGAGLLAWVGACLLEERTAVEQLMEQHVLRPGFEHCLFGERRAVE